jgi:MarR family transcriptional regulator for hemolysin
MADASEDLGILVGETARLWRYTLDQRLQPLGLSQAKWLVLVHLSRDNGLIQKNLAIRVGVEAPTLVGLLDRMAEDGWITRRESSEDRRSKTVHLTTKAQETLKQIRGTAAQLRRELLTGIPPKDIERCAAVLEQIKAAVEKVWARSE